MISAGYMYKRIILPDWLNCQNVTKVYAVSSCISKDFTNYIPYWKHNRYWFFNRPEDMDTLIRQENLSEEFELLFYELYEKEFDEEQHAWLDFTGEESFGYQVRMPPQKEFLGFDIVTYSMGTSHECSPLSCNWLCQEVQVNQYCLLDDFEKAIQITETLKQNTAEPGPYRIIRVNKVNRTP
jgi:hypothetical protein